MVDAPMYSGRAARVASVLLVATSCRQSSAVIVQPLPAVPTASIQNAAPRVQDAVAGADRAWMYADGKQLRDVLLPDLMNASASLRADVAVGLSTAATACGFQPLMTVEEFFLRIRWDTAERTTPWGAVLRMQQPFEANRRCLETLVADAQKTSLDGRPAWQLRHAIIVWDDGVFVAASSAAEARALVERMAHPDPTALNARAALSGAVLVANVVSPDPFGTQTLSVRWAPRPPASRFELHSRFVREESAKQAETIMRDGFLSLIGPTAPLDATSEKSAQGFVDRAAVSRNGATLDVVLDAAPLTGQGAVVSKLANIAVRGVRLYNAWDHSAEARDTLFVIAWALVDFANHRRELGKPARFPPSAPLVPEEIPEGKRIVPNPNAFSHPSWQDIHYSNDQPTFYSVEFATANDGKSAVVRARGDIDGNGITSLFELDVKLDAHGVPIVAPVVRERDTQE